ncbi:hypothetical protein, partial [Myxococcus sp. AB056]|uniref:hypothetical protein n=1 Tax=Myxococcus sp. AB056 TaxID=2562792 RepID=UPI001E530DC9
GQGRGNRFLGDSSSSVSVETGKSCVPWMLELRGAGATFHAHPLHCLAHEDGGEAQGIGVRLNGLHPDAVEGLLQGALSACSI